MCSRYRLLRPKACWPVSAVKSENQWLVSSCQQGAAHLSQCAQAACSNLAVCVVGRPTATHVGDRRTATPTSASGAVLGSCTVWSISGISLVPCVHAIEQLVGQLLQSRWLRPHQQRLVRRANNRQSGRRYRQSPWVATVSTQLRSSRGRAGLRFPAAGVFHAPSTSARFREI